MVSFNLLFIVGYTLHKGENIFIENNMRYLLFIYALTNSSKA